MKYIYTSLLLLAFTSFPTFGETPSDAAKDYFKLLQSKDYTAVAKSFYPEALAELKNMMSFVSEIPEEKQKMFIPALFGTEANADTLMKMSDTQFFASFLGSVMGKIDSAGGLDFSNMEVLGEVMEGTELAHVVTRNKMVVGEMELEMMEVISFKKHDKEWKALMTGKIKGFAQQMKAALTK